MRVGGRRRLLGLFLVVALASACATAPSLQTRFQSTLDDLREEYGFPGATAAYVLPDGTVGEAATGWADVERRTPMTTTSRMLSGSTGKTFVAATVLALSYEGRLNLDDPISRWLGDRPWFNRLPNHDSITVRQLLTHSSGLPDHVYMETFARDVAQKWRDPGSLFSPEALIGYVLDAEPLFEAGRGYRYTDTGYLLLGLIIERAAGRTYYEEVTRRFLQPLSLSRTLPSAGRDHPGLAAGYQSPDNAFGMPAKTTDAPGHLVYDAGAEWTGGGLVTNSRDLAVWAKALYEGAAMPHDYRRDLFAGVPMGEGEGHYGAGVYIGVSPYGPLYGHGGWIPGYRTDVRYYPDRRIAVAMQINADINFPDASPVATIRDRLTRVVIDALPAN